MGGGARLLAAMLVAASLGAAAAQQLPQGTYPLVNSTLYAPLQLVGAPTGAPPGSGLCGVQRIVLQCQN